MPQKPARGACTTYRRAKDEGYRARSAFKLMDIDDAYGLLRGAKSVVDLCAAEEHRLPIWKIAVLVNALLALAVPGVGQQQLVLLHEQAPGVYSVKDCDVFFSAVGNVQYPLAVIALEDYRRIVRAKPNGAESDWVATRTLYRWFAEQERELARK